MQLHFGIPATDPIGQMLLLRLEIIITLSTSFCSFAIPIGRRRRRMTIYLLNLHILCRLRRFASAAAVLSAAAGATADNFTLLLLLLLKATHFLCECVA